MSAERLREAASRLRQESGAPLDTALADWLDAEYVTQAEMEPLAELFNASFRAVSGKDVAAIEFGRDPAGNMVFRANTFPAALAVADAVLGGNDD